MKKSIMNLEGFRAKDGVEQEVEDHQQFDALASEGQGKRSLKLAVNIIQDQNKDDFKTDQDIWCHR